MIIPNPELKIVYHPVKDVLFVEWPEFSEKALSKAKLTLDTIIETINTYNVKYLLTDIRKVIVGIPEHHYRELGQNFAIRLAGSSVKKLARVVSESTIEEQSVEGTGKKTQFPLPVKSFATVKDALEWLTSDE